MQMVMLWIKMWTESRGRLPTYLLVGGSGLNFVHACSFFFCFLFLFCFVFVFVFFLGKKMSTRHAYQWSRQNEDFSCNLEFWTCFPEVHWNWILDVLPRGPMVRNLDVLFRGLMDLNLDMLPRGPRIWILDVLCKGPIDLKFGGFVEGDICANVYGSFTLVLAK